MKKILSLTIEDEIIIGLTASAEREHMNRSKFAEKIFKEFLKNEPKKENMPVPVVEEVVVSNEERIADWKWRKEQVAEGKLPQYMADEFPATLRADEDEEFANRIRVPLI